MQLREWDEKQVKWDAYRTPHISFHGDWHTPLFVQFEDGGMMLRRMRYKPGFRRTYKDIGVQIVAGHDHDLPPLMFPDGRKCPKAWVSNQTLVVDLDTRVVVSTSMVYKCSYGGERPSHARNSAVYWPFPGARPWGGKVYITRPKKLDKAERAHVTEIVAACKAWWEFGGRDKNTFARWELQHTLRHPHVLGHSFADLEPRERAMIALNGLKSIDETTRTDYLLLATP
jgi:hypothetical protein